MTYFQTLVTPDWLGGLEHMSLGLIFFICKMERKTLTWPTLHGRTKDE